MGRGRHRSRHQHRWSARSSTSAARTTTTTSTSWACPGGLATADRSARLALDPHARLAARACPGCAGTRPAARAAWRRPTACRSASSCGTSGSRRRRTSRRTGCSSRSCRLAADAFEIVGVEQGLTTFGIRSKKLMNVPKEIPMGWTLRDAGAEPAAAILISRSSAWGASSLRRLIGDGAVHHPGLVHRVRADQAAAGRFRLQLRGLARGGRRDGGRRDARRPCARASGSISPGSCNTGIGSAASCAAISAIRSSGSSRSPR